MLVCLLWVLFNEMQVLAASCEPVFAMTGKEAYVFFTKCEIMRATNFCNLKSVVARITTHLKHCNATKFRCCKLKQHVASSLNWRLLFSKRNIFNLQQQNFVALQCLRWLVIRATTLFNLPHNNVALQVEERCCPYYRAFKERSVIETNLFFPWLVLKQIKDKMNKRFFPLDRKHFYMEPRRDFCNTVAPYRQLCKSKSKYLKGR